MLTPYSRNCRQRDKTSSGTGLVYFNSCINTAFYMEVVSNRFWLCLTGVFLRVNVWHEKTVGGRKGRDEWNNPQREY